MEIYLGEAHMNRFPRFWHQPNNFVIGADCRMVTPYAPIRCGITIIDGPKFAIIHVFYTIRAG